MTKYSEELRIAKLAAEQAGSIQMRYAGNPPQAHTKDDGSPVTAVDRECEEIIRDAILKHFPGDGFLGEESGALPGSSGRTWIVDPLDGTRPFLRGIPTYSVLIALEQENMPVVGIMHFAGLAQTYWATRSGGAFCNDQLLRVSTVDNPESALGSALGFVERADEQAGRRLFSLMRQWDYRYGFMDAYSYACVASGRADVCVNLLDKPWDCAAAACIVSEAGGRFSDIHGNPSVHNGSIILSNSLLHDATVQWFS